MFSSVSSLLWALIIGIIVGALARLLLPGKEAFPPGAMGWLLTAVLGIVGALLGTWIGGALWGGAGYQAGWIMSIVGAIVVLLLVRLIMGSRTSS